MAVLIHVYMSICVCLCMPECSAPSISPHSLATGHSGLNENIPQYLLELFGGGLAGTALQGRYSTTSGL